jgi:uncharacterized protein
MNSIEIGITQFGIGRRAARAAGMTLSAIALFAAACGYAQAASFQCRHSLSSSEKLVCKDPELSSLDDKLSTLYKRAQDLTPDRDALEADRLSQWSWRQQHCTDKACVNNWYVRRITELDADIQQGQQAQISSLKANLTAQNLPTDAQEAVLQIEGVHPTTAASQ